MLRLQLQLTQLLIYDFDIIEFSNINNHDIISYDKILIDGNIFNTI
jgi:molybdopterin/thiamine biosynthesis adenylyltransferase